MLSTKITLVLSCLFSLLFVVYAAPVASPNELLERVPEPAFGDSAQDWKRQMGSMDKDWKRGMGGNDQDWKRSNGMNQDWKRGLGGMDNVQA